MKKSLILIFIISISFLSGCKSSGKLKFNETDTFTPCNNVILPKEEKIKLEEEYVKKVNDSYFKLVNELYVESENLIYSPLSTYLALSMVAEGVSDESYEEMMSFLNCENIETLREINKNLFINNNYKNNKGTVKLANSFWSDYKIDINQEYSDTLANNYFSEVYKMDFSNEKDKDNIFTWINHKTNGFLNITKEKMPINEKTIAMLINTVYFNNQWKEKYNYAYKDKFYGSNTKKVDYMNHTVHTKYYKNDKYEIFYDKFTNNNSIAFLLLDNDENIIDYINYNFLEEDLDYEMLNATIYLPKFKYFGDYDIRGALEKIGINKIFTTYLEKISPDDIVISSIKQQAGIEFSLEGVEAAAVTSAEINAESVTFEVEILVNRPFIYYILDNNGVILFSGIVQNM